MAGYDLSTDRLYGHIVTRKGRTEFLAFARYLRSLHPAHVRIAIVMDNYSPHLSTKVDTRVGDWAQANNVEIAYVSFYGSWLNRIEPQFTALRYFALDGTDHSSHHEQASMIRRYIAWRNSHLTDPSYAKSSAEPAPSNGQRLPDAVLGLPRARLPPRRGFRCRAACHGGTSTQYWLRTHGWARPAAQSISGVSRSRRQWRSSYPGHSRRNGPCGNSQLGSSLVSSMKRVRLFLQGPR
jgi:hypothetical protein